MSAITFRNDSQFKLRVDLEDWEGQKRYAIYDDFKISGDSEQFRLYIGSYSGNAGRINFIRHRANFCKFYQKKGSYLNF